MAGDFALRAACFKKGGNYGFRQRVFGLRFGTITDVKTVTYKPMMGEFLLYVNGKLFGGVYDDRFLVKITESAKRLLPDAPLELPYEGAKPMLLVEDLDDRAFLTAFFRKWKKSCLRRRKESDFPSNLSRDFRLFC